MRKVRGIIFGLNAMVSALLTLNIVVTAYGDIHGMRAVWIGVAGFAAIYGALVVLENLILKKGREDEKEGQGKNNRGSVPGIPWHKNRFSVDEQKNRNPGKHVAKI